MDAPQVVARDWSSFRIKCGFKKSFLGRASGGRRWVVLDIVEGYWEGLSASTLSSSKRVFVKKKLREGGKKKV